MDAVIPAVIVGGGLYVLVNQDKPGPPGQTIYGSPPYGATLGDQVSGIPTGGGGSGDNSGQAAFNSSGGLLQDPDARKKLDLLNQGLQKAYSGMSSAAKATAAAQMNDSLNLDPPLKGNEDWDTVARVAGGAVGGIACNAIPGIGTAASPLCAMAGSYLGVKLENWMATDLGGLQGWISDNLGAVVDIVGDQLSDWFHEIF